MGYVEVVGQLQDRPFMRTAGHRARAGARRPQALAHQYATDCVPRQGRTPLRGTPAFGRQGLRNRGCREPLRMERAEPVHQGGIITQLLQSRDWSVEGGGRGRPTRPVEGQGHLFRRALQSDDDALDELTDNRLLIRGGGRRGMPEGRNIGGSTAHGLLGLGRERDRLLGEKAGILGLYGGFRG
jgi:hypothetical protein